MANLKVDPDKLKIGDIVSVQAFIVGFEKDPVIFEPLVIVQFGKGDKLKVKLTDIITGPL